MKILITFPSLSTTGSLCTGTANAVTAVNRGVSGVMG